MHTELDAFFDEHDKPSHASKRHVHDKLGAILALAVPVRMQLVKYKGLLEQAEMASHDHSMDGTLEHIRQTIDAADRELGKVVDHGRNLALAFTQLERYMADQRKFLEAGNPAPPPVPRLAGTLEPPTA